VYDETENCDKEPKEGLGTKMDRLKKQFNVVSLEFLHSVYSSTLIMQAAGSPKRR
jgi:hypothetical protein